MYSFYFNCWKFPRTNLFDTAILLKLANSTLVEMLWNTDKSIRRSLECNFSHKSRWCWKKWDDSAKGTTDIPQNWTKTTKRSRRNGRDVEKLLARFAEISLLLVVRSNPGQVESFLSRRHKGWISTCWRDYWNVGVTENGAHVRVCPTRDTVARESNAACVCSSYGDHVRGTCPRVSSLVRGCRPWPHPRQPRNPAVMLLRPLFSLSLSQRERENVLQRGE